jgi:translation initiation factor 5B
LQQQTGGSGTASKKFSYGSKKKKTPQTGTSTKESTPISTPLLTTKALTPEPEPSPPTLEEKPSDVKDDWDLDSGEEKPGKTSAADVKSDWDASSGDEKPVPKPVAGAKGTPSISPANCDPTTLEQLQKIPHMGIPRRSPLRQQNHLR